MVERWRIAVPKLAGEEERNGYIYLPVSYYDDPERRYPVLYMFDGHNVFFDQDATYGKSWGMGEYLDYTGTPLIVAAIECSHSPDNGRLKEYSPFTFRDSRFGTVTGMGKKTMDWMSGPFKQMIDGRLRTLPDRKNTWIAGSSMGGLMSLYALLEYNHIYSRGAALSPSLWTSAEKVNDMIVRSRIKKDTVLYMDYGSEELKNHAGMLKGFSRAASLIMEKGIFLTLRIVPGGTHCEASWEKQIPFFMNALFS